MYTISLSSQSTILKPYSYSLTILCICPPLTKGVTIF
ncbi:hypothetical protein AI2884V1_1876 [Serratia marcescens]|nr:hypothetical protein AI2872V1_1876 [Serratia marcescens]CAF2661186.1 hypothetical protein AI2884V1_1876 [Serratia marcescens]CAH5198188.1 hypothetical protein AI2872V1_1876 [Serratia marcescens]CAH5236590.1 hypothetical protein AI2884V1_1876 [Serratia marcescens]